MKRLFLFFWLLLAAQASAAPHIPGMRVGTNAGLTLLGQPTPDPPAGTAPLVAGSTPFGSWAATAVPGVQGSGDTTNAIMGWEEPPFAPITTTNNEVCAMAFHRPKDATRYAAKPNDMAKVRFIANAGTPVDVTTETVSSRSGKLMWCTNLELTGVPNNTVVEIRAIGYPTHGQPVVLQGDYNLPFFQSRYALPLVANYTPTRYYLATAGDGGSDSNNCTSGSPCLTLGRAKTVAGSGDYSNIEICLKAGSNWDISDNTATVRAANSGFFVVRPCPGVSKASVTVTNWGDSGPRVTRMKIEDVNFTPKNLSLTDQSALWFKNPSWDGNCLGTSGCKLIFNSQYDRGLFLTEGDYTDAEYVTANAVLYRNVAIGTINSDVGQNVKVIINSTLENTTFCCSVHPDMNQISVPQGGLTHIVYGLATLNPVDSVVLFSSDTGICTDCAYVDIDADNTENPTRKWWDLNAAGAHTNIYFRNLNIVTGASGIDGESAGAANWTVIDSTCNVAIGPNGGVLTFYGSPTCD